MGLDLSHNAGHFSYSGFNTFRKKLASLIGIEIEKMQGFGFYNTDTEYVAASIPWESLTPDPIHLLLNHSDCEGSLDVKDLPSIVTRLKEIRITIPKTDELHYIMFTAQMIQLIDGFERAIRLNENIEFS